MTGTVYKSNGNLYSVHTDSNEIYTCNIKGKFRSLGIKSTNPIAVGDSVNFEVLDRKEFIGIIYEIKKRKNYIIRKSVNLSKLSHIIASNIDSCFLFVTPNNPTTSSVFIDRVLVATRSFGIETIILFNKIDLYTKSEIEHIDYLRNIYIKIGYKCLNISVLKRINIEKVIDMMKNRISIFTGHSGVGKSSLINLLDPKLNLKIGRVSEQNEQGQHTTTFAEMFNLNFGGKIIDSPGIKGFGLIDIEKSEIRGYFSELEFYKDDCKFKDCLHENEPKCGIKEAVNSGVISESRYKSYLSMLVKDNKNYRTDFWN